MSTGYQIIEQDSMCKLPQKQSNQKVYKIVKQITPSDADNLSGTTQTA